MKKIKIVHQSLLILFCVVSLSAVPPRFEVTPKASKKAKWNFEIVNSNKEGAIQISIVQLAPTTPGASRRFRTLFVKREVREGETFRTIVQRYQKIGIVIWDKKGISTVWTIAPGKKKKIFLLWNEEEGLLPQKATFMGKTKSGMSIKQNIRENQIFIGDAYLDNFSRRANIKGY